MKKKKLKKRKPTKRQAKFVEAYLDPAVNTVAEAARIAGYGSRARGCEALQTVTVQDMLDEIRGKVLARGGTTDVIAQRIADGLHAVETQFFQKDGIVKDARTLIDYAGRERYIRLAGELLGVLKTKGSGGNGKHLHLHLGDKSSKHILDVLTEQLDFMQAQPAS